MSEIEIHFGTASLYLTVLYCDFCKSNYLNWNILLNKTGKKKSSFSSLKMVMQFKPTVTFPLVLQKRRLFFQWKRKFYKKLNNLTLFKEYAYYNYVHQDTISIQLKLN